MPKSCTIPNCRFSSHFRGSRGVSHHTFPKDQKIAKRWIQFVRYTKRSFEPSPSTVICSKHFAPRCFQNLNYRGFLENSMGVRHYASLKPDAVPTILFAHKAEEAVLAEKDEPLREESDDLSILDNDDQSESGENFKEVTPWESKIEKEFKARKKSLHFVKLTDINAYITCFLCGGYMFNATTITECLHSFCRKCILQHFQKDNRCPTCDILIHESIPFNYIRQDGHLQIIINKLMPNMERMEKEGEKQFGDGQPELPPTTAPLNPAAEIVPVYSKTVSSSQISLQLDYLGASSECPPVTPLEKRFIRVSSQATIAHVQKFITHKLNLSDQFEVDIICGEEILQPAVILYNLKREVEKEQIVDNILVLSYSLGFTGS